MLMFSNILSHHNVNHANWDAMDQFIKPVMWNVTSGLQSLVRDNTWPFKILVFVETTFEEYQLLTDKQAQTQN